MDQLQIRIESKGNDIFKSLDSGDNQSVFNKDWWYGKIMDWSMKNSSFKTQMFRFVDVLPTLGSSQEVARHLKEYFAEGGDALPSVFNFGLGLGSLAPGLMAGAIKKNVTQMAKMFITGENPQEAVAVLKKSRQDKKNFTIDILGEACLSEAEALDYQNRYLELISWLSKEVTKWKADPQLDMDHRGDIPRVNISVKLTALYSQIHPEAWQHSIDKAKERLRPVFQKAKEDFAFINVDMEKYHIKDLTIETFKQLLMEEEFKNYPHFGIVIQCYLRDSYKDVQDLIDFAKKRGTPFSIRLVKGAYWDYETVGAKQKGWPCPVYTKKPESDINFENCTKLMLDNNEHINLAIGSHNVRSLAFAMSYAESIGLPKNSFELQMLYGMADPFKKSITSQGYRLREYCPVGDLIPGMSYLVRRLLENTSNESFLKSKFADNTSEESLLMDPKAKLASMDSPSAEIAFPFQNEAPLDFAIPGEREKTIRAIEQFKKSSFGKKWPACINNDWQSATDWMDTYNPSTGEVIGQIAMCDHVDAEKAMQAANKAFATWSKTEVKVRADLIDKVASIFVRDRYEIMAAQVLEAGKTWAEADGDVGEAIDFCRYYANDMRRIGQPRRVGHAPGEVSRYSYQGRGVNVVIAPWNFPLAILTGMVAASVVTGNTVVMKPAEQTSIIANFLMKAFIEAQAPKGVVNMVTGVGEIVGEYMVNHVHTAMICFTGSKDVGLHILQKAAIVQPGQRHIKRTITELGGKNAIIIDSDADLDEAVAGVLYSAFGFQGQKCSAASRAIVLEEIYDRFVTRLVESARSMQMGPSEDPASTMGPVIDENAYKKILSYIEIGRQEAKLAFQGDVPNSKGYFVPPTIFTEVPPVARIAHEEIFGPVLAVIKVKSLEEALAIANDTDYALTGAVFSRSPGNIEKIREDFNVGNLYINRGSTGAMVERHPFGGFKLSGGGSKTGGPDYLIQFMDPKVVTENTLRRGFAPEEV
jgi:RHH-type transcriptional regulator, proline utilization regulon repressor / proline dehydrogenase / delta 1-pyrroline-5-carboxylate dehydrogenase